MRIRIKGGDVLEINVDDMNDAQSGVLASAEPGSGFTSKGVRCRMAKNIAPCSSERSHDFVLSGDL